MKAKCSLCNTYWSVSIYAQFPKDGYLCPRCRREIKNSKKIRCLNENRFNRRRQS